jgi:uncharacterized FAD-dependent dehydrogenase
MVPRRVELGVRLEQDEDAFFLRDEINLDPKLLLRGTMGDEVRTFCCCRGGKVLTTSFLGIASVSGRADCPPTGRSNVGLLVRVPIESQAVVWRTFVQRSSQEAILGIPLSSVRWGSDPRLTAVGIGFPLQRTIGAAIDEFRRIYPSVDEGRPLIYAPAVEGVHLYPEVNSSLRMETVPVWVAGDSTGAFRGLTAALVSGHFCALGVIEEVK